MSGTEVSAEEQAGLDAVFAVEDVKRHKRLVPNGRGKTPDWRVTVADGRVADVEVTTCTDGAVAAFFAELHEKDGSLRVWSDERLSYQWTVSVFDRSPVTNKKRRPIEKLLEGLVSTMAALEAAGGTPEQMQSRAQGALDGSLLVSRTSDTTITLTDFPGLQIDDGERSQRVHLNGAPELVGPARGSVVLVPFGGPRGLAGCGLLISAVKQCIQHKTEKHQLDDAPGLKWLAVVLDGAPGFLLSHHFGRESRLSPPTLDGISFDYFDEVWVVVRTRIGEDREEGLVVLRFSDCGREQQHHVVTRSAAAVQQRPSDGAQHEPKQQPTNAGHPLHGGSPRLLQHAGPQPA